MLESIEKVRRAVKGGIRKADLAREAGVHPDSLAAIEDANWRPQPRKLDALAAAVDRIIGRIIGENP